VKKSLLIALSLGGALLGGAPALAAAQAAPVAAPAAPAPDAARSQTRAEAIAAADRRFAAMDANHDGTVTAEERHAWRDARRAARGGADAATATRPDRAGKRRGMKSREITQADFRERALRMFDRMDTNHDGVVDARERQAARLLMRARMTGGSDDGAN
jgi:hypothetical protein